LGWVRAVGAVFSGMIDAVLLRALYYCRSRLLCLIAYAPFSLLLPLFCSKFDTAVIAAATVRCSWCSAAMPFAIMMMAGVYVPFLPQVQFCWFC
jgi:hypothetical protein